MSSDSPPPPRRRGRPGRDASPPLPRSELLHRSFVHFARHGYEASSIRELAQELGVSDSLFHHYFGSKQALWREAVDAFLLPGRDLLLAGLAQAGEADALRRLRDSTLLALRLVLNNPLFFQFVFREMSQPSERGDYLQSLLDAYLERVDAILLEAQGQGRLRPLPLEAAHLLMLGAVRMLVEPGPLRQRLAALQGQPDALDACIDGVVAIFFEGMQAG